MATTETAIATRVHVAGPPEKWPTNRRRPGWEWQQRCLRCDCVLSRTGVWFLLGAEVHELTSGRLTTEPPPDSHADSAPHCAPED